MPNTEDKAVDRKIVIRLAREQAWSVVGSTKRDELSRLVQDGDEWHGLIRLKTISGEGIIARRLFNPIRAIDGVEDIEVVMVSPGLWERVFALALPSDTP